ncbi:MAG: hypothetical protein QOH35_2880 [Acidobacteriaceae bacterium]|nr:hypothetical protein [Acidobacteriaceae bacterium]
MIAYNIQICSLGGLMGLRPTQGDEKCLRPATTLYRTVALPFVISTGAQRSGEISVLMPLLGNVFLCLWLRHRNLRDSFCNSISSDRRSKAPIFVGPVHRFTRSLPRPQCPTPVLHAPTQGECCLLRSSSPVPRPDKRRGPDPGALPARPRFPRSATHSDG